MNEVLFLLEFIKESDKIIAEIKARKRKENRNIDEKIKYREEHPEEFTNKTCEQVLDKSL